MRGGKRYVGVNHRRWGKDKLSLNAAAVLQHKRIGTAWHMLPEASQARKAIWDAVDEFTGVRLIDQAFPPEIRDSTRESDMFIRFKTGGTWQVVGSDNYNSLLGSPPTLVVFSEFAYANPASWQKLSPILLNNNGVAIFISTPCGRNHFHGLYEFAKAEMLAGRDWFAQLQTIDDTGVFTPAQILAEERQLAAQRGQQEANAIIRQEYYCSFEAAIPGAYYGAVLEAMDRSNQITSVPYDPGFMVETWWDLGIRDDTAIWFVQKVGREHRIIDYYESAGVGLDHYAQVLRERNYNYAPIACVLPHDAGHAQLSQRGGASLAAVLKTNYGYGNRIIPQTKSLQWSINQVRSFLPTCVFDAVRCKDGLDKLRQYRRKWNDITRAYHDTPLHDFSSHAADSFRTGVEGVKGMDRLPAGANPATMDYTGQRQQRGNIALHDADPLGRDY